jgi:RAB protein geranylgeranyltransferase component A
VAPKGKFIAFVSTEAESDNIQSELKPGIDLLGPVDELFFDMYDRYEPVNEPSLDNCFISTVIVQLMYHNNRFCCFKLFYDSSSLCRAMMLPHILRQL